MTTYKVCCTQILINRVQFKPDTGRIEYYIGNDIKREFIVNNNFSLGTNIIKYENFLILSELSTKIERDRIYWYNGVSMIIQCGNHATIVPLH